VPERIRTFVASRFALVSVFALIVIALAGWLWIKHQRAAMERAITQRLDTIRTRGEPASSGDLARLFPDPPTNANGEILFAQIFAVSTNLRGSGDLPIISSTPMPLATQPFPPLVSNAIASYCAASTELTNVFPWPLPAGTRFGSHWQNGIQAPRVRFVAVRTTVQSLALHTLNAIEQRDTNSAARLLEQMFLFCQALDWNDALVTHMIRDACDGLTFTVAERALNQLEFTDEQLARLGDAVQLEPTNAMANTGRAEFCLVVSAFNAAHYGTNTGASFFQNRSTDPWWRRAFDRIRDMRPIYSDSDFLLFLDMSTNFIPALELPAPEAGRRIMNILTNVTPRAHSHALDMSLPHWGKALSTHAQKEGRMTSLKVALAVERFRRTHRDKLPRSLNELAEYLPAMPRDPFNHGPLRLKKLLIGYRIYTVGMDETDSNGGGDDTGISVER
jgi:hypothetical protein